MPCPHSSKRGCVPPHSYRGNLGPLQSSRAGRNSPLLWLKGHSKYLRFKIPKKDAEWDFCSTSQCLCLLRPAWRWESAFKGPKPCLPRPRKLQAWFRDVWQFGFRITAEDVKNSTSYSWKGKEGQSGVGTVIIWPHRRYLEIIVLILMIKFFLEYLYAFSACKDTQPKKKKKLGWEVALNFIANCIRN